MIRLNENTIVVHLSEKSPNIPNCPETKDVVTTTTSYENFACASGLVIDKKSLSQNL
jgi:hypothetical protein